MADFAVVAAQGEREPCLAIVDSKAPGIARKAVATIDPSRSHARIMFDNTPADAFRAARAPMRPATCSTARRCCWRSSRSAARRRRSRWRADYARERYAFGRPIGSFQAIKHKLADIYIAVELARSNAYYGAWALNGAAELPLAAAVARISASDAGWLAAKENIQTHGGMGFTWQMDCHSTTAAPSCTRWRWAARASGSGG